MSIIRISIKFLTDIAKQLQFIFALTISALSFIVGLFFGFIVGISSGSPPQTAFEILREFVKYFQPFSPLSALFIFLKNTLAVIIIWIFGSILILPSIYSLGLNGYIVGRVISWISIKHSSLLAISSIIPHGIIEIPALILAGTAGILLGLNITCRILNFIKLFRVPILGFGFKDTFKIVLISILMLIPAAIIETFITPLIASSFT